MIEIIETNDGSQTLYRVDIDETYHSRSGAVAESRHVFIKQGLSILTKDKVNILEIGFGTGLNALCVEEFLSFHKEKSVFYHTLEPFILKREIYSELEYSKSFDFEDAQAFFMEIHGAKWDVEVEINKQFKILKSETTFQLIDLNHNQYDLLFFDAFAPQKQSEMWEIAVLKKCYEVLNSRGVLVTYCAQGQFRRNLESVGFAVERLEGPPGKREMIRAIKS